MQTPGVQLRGLLICVVYRKSLRLAPAARQRRSTGETVNIMQVDAMGEQPPRPTLTAVGRFFSLRSVLELFLVLLSVMRRCCGILVAVGEGLCSFF